MVVRAAVVRVAEAIPLTYPIEVVVLADLVALAVAIKVAAEAAVMLILGE